jgi:hypothetical protein
MYSYTSFGSPHTAFITHSILLPNPPSL